MHTQQDDHLTLYAFWQKGINAGIQSALEHHKGTLGEISRYACVETKGSRNRGIIAQAVHKLITGSDDITQLAIGLDLAQDATLPLDDMLDKATMRRNMPSTPAKFGATPTIIGVHYMENIARQALQQGFFDLSEHGLSLSQASYLQHMNNVVYEVIGSLLTSAYDESTYNTDSPPSIDALTRNQIDKNALFRLAYEPFLFGRKIHSKLISSLWRNTAFCYQALDDINDVHGDSTKMGKPTKQDTYNLCTMLGKEDLITKINVQKTELLNTVQNLARQFPHGDHQPLYAFLHDTLK